MSGASELRRLSIENVAMYFGGLHALDDVSLAVERGSVLGLIGPNGSGKTTLMNVVSGVFKPTYGNVRFNGRRIADVPTYAVCRPGHRAHVSSRQPFANLTVRENVAVGAMYGRNGRERNAAAAFARADELCEIVGWRASPAALRAN